MSRLLGVVCAAALLASGGCLSFLGLGPWWDGHKMVAAGRPETIAEMLEAGLPEGGVKKLERKRIDDEIRLAGISKGDRVFCLHLKKARGNGEQTEVSLRWNDREADAKLWPLVKEILGTADENPSPMPEGS